MRTRLVNGMIEMTDTRDGTIVVSPQSMSLHVPTPSSAGVTPLDRAPGAAHGL
ncbi:MAG: hypothetical protein V9F04_01180 [Dermatophilaceae bacterium]